MACAFVAVCVYRMRRNDVDPWLSGFLTRNSAAVETKSSLDRIMGFDRENEMNVGFKSHTLKAMRPEPPPTNFYGLRADEVHLNPGNGDPRNRYGLTRDRRRDETVEERRDDGFPFGEALQDGTAEHPRVVDPVDETPPDSAGATEEQAPASNRPYTVEKNDNLWKIAAKLLGKGHRYREIEKLNAKLLAGKRFLPEGIVLRVPLQ